MGVLSGAEDVPLRYDQGMPSTHVRLHRRRSTSRALPVYGYCGSFAFWTSGPHRFFNLVVQQRPMPIASCASKGVRFKEYGSFCRHEQKFRSNPLENFFSKGMSAWLRKKGALSH